MVDGKKYRESRKLNLATPRRGIRRVNSVLRERGITPARNETRCRVDKKSRTAISHDTGHALNWVDSLIRKGKGILDSLEEEEHAFKREILQERQQKKIRQGLVESALSEQITQAEGYGTDTSFKRFNDTIRNSLTNSCDDLQDLQDLPHLQSEQNSLDEQEKQKKDISGDDIIILTDDDEEVSNEAEESEAPEEIHLGQWEDIELVTSDQDSKQEQEDETNHEDTEDELEDSKESEASDNSYENELEGKNSQSDVDDIEDREGKKEIGDRQKLQECQELEIAKKLASGLFSASRQPSDSDEPEEDHDMSIYYEAIHDIETMPQTLLTESRAINAHENDPQCAKEIIVVRRRNEEEDEKLEKQEFVQERSEEEIMDQLKREIFEEQQQQDENEKPDEKEESEKEKEEEEEEGTAELTQMAQEDQEAEGGDEQELRIEEKFQDNDRKYAAQLEIAEKEDSHDTLQNLSDYQMIATQAVQQLTNPTNRADHSSSIDENSMGINPNSGNAIRGEMKEKDCENPVLTAAEKQKERHKGISMLENLFKPRVFQEESNAGALSSVEDDSIYYSVDEIVQEKSSTGVASEEENVSSHYEILFCDSSYSSTSNEDEESIKKSTPEYVSPFTENPFIAARKLKDPKAILRKTLESLGESFDSDSEDQIMEDAREFPNSSDDEYFSQGANATTNNNTSSIIALEGNNNVSTKDSDLTSNTDTDDGEDNASQKTFCGDGSPPVNIPKAVTKFELKKFHLEEASISFSGLAEPCHIEEYESEESIHEYHQNLVLEEITSSTEESPHFLIESEPLVEFVSSEPPNHVNMVDIILDEFTAPDFIEEVECESDMHYDELMLEEVSCLESDYPVISTNPIIEHPEPLLFSNIEISDVTRGSTDEASAINNAISSGLLEEVEDPEIPAAPLSGNFILGALGSSISSQSSNECEPLSNDLKATSTEPEAFNNRPPFSMTTKIFSSPSKALNSVISGVKSVGNALTDFVKTIDVMDSESENDAEKDSPEGSNRAKRKLTDSSKSAISEVGDAVNEFVKRIDVIDSDSVDFSESESCDETIQKKRKLNGSSKGTILNVCDAVSDFVKTVDVIDSESENYGESTSSDGTISMKQEFKSNPGDNILGFGDAVTNFVKTIDVIDSESGKDEEESSSDESVREKFITDDIPKNKTSSLKKNPTQDDPDMTKASIAQNPTEAFTKNLNKSDKEHILSEVAALQQLAASIKNNSFSELRDEPCCEKYAYDNQRKDNGILVKKDIKPEMDLKDIGSPKRNQKKLYAQDEKIVAQDDILGDSFMKDVVEPLRNSPDGNCCIGEDINDNIHLPNTFPEKIFVKDGLIKDRNIEEGDMRDDRGDDDSHSVVTSSRNTPEATSGAVRHIEVMSDDSENELQVTSKNHLKDNQEENVGIRNVVDEKKYVPVTVASEEVEASARNSPTSRESADKQESLQEKKTFKKASSKKRKDNEQGDNTGRRKKPSTGRAQKARSKGPITRSRTNPPPSSKKTKRNTRSRKRR